MKVFVWHEMAIESPGKVLDFYARIFDATVNKRQIASARDSYYILEKGDRWFTGIFKPAVGIEVPAWYGVVRVENLKEAIESVEGMGGRVMAGPVDEEGIGRHVYMYDSCGGKIELVQFEHDLFPVKPNDGVDWSELVVYDVERALDFYAGAFGWKVIDEMDGRSGRYYILSYDGNVENAFGGVYSSLSQEPGWRYYFHVDFLDEALRKIKALGGEVIDGPEEIPGGWIASCRDPEGNRFHLHAPVR